MSYFLSERKYFASSFFLFTLYLRRWLRVWTRSSASFCITLCTRHSQAINHDFYTVLFLSLALTSCQDLNFQRMFPCVCPSILLTMKCLILTPSLLLFSSSSLRAQSWALLGTASYHMPSPFQVSPLFLDFVGFGCYTHPCWNLLHNISPNQTPSLVLGAHGTKCRLHAWLPLVQDSCHLSLHMAPD